MKNYILFLVLASALAFGQGQSGYIGGGKGVIISTVAGLPVGQPIGTPAVVTDASTSTDCTIGGGSTLVLCRWGGAAWGTFPAGTAAPGGLTTQLQYNNAGAQGGISGWTTNGTTTLSAGATSILDLHVAGTGGLLLPGALGTGFVRVTTSTGALSSAELSGDVTTSGSGAATVVGFKGSALPTLAAGYLHYTGTAFEFAAGTGGGSPGGASGTLQFNSAGTLGGVTGSSVSGGKLTLGDTLTVIPGTTTVPSLVLNAPVGSTADLFDAQVNGLTLFSINNAGEASFPAGTATQNGASFLINPGVESSPATKGEVIFDSSNMEEIYNGTIWQHTAYAETVNSFSNQNKFTQPNATTVELSMQAAATPTTDFATLANSAGTVQLAVGCQTTNDAQCPAAFGIYAPAFATIGPAGTAGQKAFLGGTSQGPYTDSGGNHYASIGGGATMAASYNIQLPSAAPSSNQLWEIGTCTTNDCTGSFVNFPTFANLAPSPTRAGDIIYYNGSNWVTLAGNNTGTQVLQETSTGVPSWATVSGTGTVTHTVGALGAQFAAVGNGGADIETLDQQTSKYVDYPESAAPASPAVGNDRVWLDSTSHTLSCKTSSGANCAPTGGSSPYTSVYSTASTGNTAAITATTMTTVGASDANYEFKAYIEQSSNGTCSTFPTITLNLIYTDAATGNAYTAQQTLLRGSGNATGNFQEVATAGVAQSATAVARIHAKASTNIQYSASIGSPTCTTTPTYDVYPSLVTAP